MNRRYRVVLAAMAAIAAPALAQQVPGAIKPPPIELEKGHGPGASRGQPAPPAIPMPTGGDETGRLLRAQTEALRALSARLDQMERRIDRLERGGR